MTMDSAPIGDFPCNGYTCPACQQWVGLGVTHTCQWQYPHTISVPADDTELRIRADERRRCMSELEALAQEYIERWAKIMGEDRAKACAFDIVSCARRLASQSEGKSGG